MTISAGKYTINSVSGDYSSWTAFEADIVNLTGELEGQGTGREDFIEQVTFAGFDTTASNKIILRGVDQGRHSGKVATGCRIIDTQAGGFGTLQFSTPVMHWEVYDLEVVNEGSGSSPFRMVATTASLNGTVVVDRCLVYAVRGGDISEASAGGVFGMSGATWADFDSVDFYNSVCMGFDNGLGGDGSDTTTLTATNVVVVRGHQDLDVTSTGIRYAVAVNCIVLHYGPTSSHRDYLNLGAGSSNNISSDDSGSSADLQFVTIDELFVNPKGPFDFHLLQSSVARNAGTPVAGVIYDFTRQTRDTVTPDIGADEWFPPDIDTPLGPAIIKVPWTKQPPAGIKIDRSNPLTEGLVAAYNFNNSGYLRDLVGNNHGVVSLGAPTLISTPQGVAVHMNGDKFSIPNHPDLQFISQDQTILMGVTPQGSTFDLEFVEKQNGTINLWQMKTNEATASFEWFVKGSTSTIEQPNSSVWTVGRYYNVAGRVDYAEDTVSVWVNGIEELSVVNGTDGDFETDTPITVGGGTVGNVNSYFHYLYIFRSAKTDAELESLHSNPWQIFEPRRIYIGKPEDRRAVKF